MLNNFNNELGSLRKLYPNIDFYFFHEIDSTNNFCKQLSLKDFTVTSVVVSNTQTSGRGTKGRYWMSPKDKGLWFSILLKPTFPLEYLNLIPLLTALSLHDTFKNLGINTYIKWPNDIILNDKKLCGILTESNISKDTIDYLIIGIGINVNFDIDDFDISLKDIATSLKIYSGCDFSRLEILNNFLINFNTLYLKLLSQDISYILEKYKANSYVLNKKVSLHYNNSYEFVTPIDILDDGALLVKDSNDLVKKIYSGEVSLRF